jgi:hypothetical protein
MQSTRLERLLCRLGRPESSRSGAHYPIAGPGEKGWLGRFSSAKMEALRSSWFDAADFEPQKRVAEQI